VNFADQTPSEQWAALKYRGQKFAEVWFKPEGQPFALTFRIPPESFQIPGMDHLLTTENLLKAVGLAATEVESWRHEGVSHPGMDGANPELRHPLAPPGDDIHLGIYVSLKMPQVVAPDASIEPETLTIRWQDLESRWRAILDSEATIETLRLTMEGLVAQIENAAKQTLTTEEKLHARRSDVALLTKAKTRVHHAVPKVKEFIHRGTWVIGTPEKKKLEELFKDHNHPDIPLPQMYKLADQLENLLKDRQVLSSQGVTVCQECRTVATGIQGALTTLRSNAAANADRKRRAGRPKGKFFKHVRKWSGAD
jgi:hypothetical protein